MATSCLTFVLSPALPILFLQTYTCIIQPIKQANQSDHWTRVIFATREFLRSVIMHGISIKIQGVQFCSLKSSNKHWLFCQIYTLVNAWMATSCLTFILSSALAILFLHTYTCIIQPIKQAYQSDHWTRVIFATREFFGSVIMHGIFIKIQGAQFCSLKRSNKHWLFCQIYALVMSYVTKKTQFMNQLKPKKMLW